MKRHALALSASLLVAAPAAASGPDAVMALEPDKDLTPPEVVRAQLAALAHNRALGGDRGIEVTFRFASPENRRSTGPLERFQRMLHRGYGALLDHRRAALGALKMDGFTAMQAVFVQAADGSRHAYVFVLGLQEDGEHRGCWMTDAVMELDLEGGGDSESGDEDEPEVI